MFPPPQLVPSPPLLTPFQSTSLPPFPYPPIPTPTPHHHIPRLYVRSMLDQHPASRLVALHGGPVQGRAPVLQIGKAGGGTEETTSATPVSLFHPLLLIEICPRPSHIVSHHLEALRTSHIPLSSPPIPPLPSILHLPLPRVLATTRTTPCFLRLLSHAPSLSISHLPMHTHNIPSYLSTPTAILPYLGLTVQSPPSFPPRFDLSLRTQAPALPHAP